MSVDKGNAGTTLAVYVADEAVKAFDCSATSVTGSGM